MYFCPNCNNVFDITKNPHATEAKESDQKGGERKDYTSIIDKILNKKEVTKSDIEKFDLEQLIKEPTYKKLKQEQKELVYNKIKELLPIDKSSMQKEGPVDKAYFICKNCGFLKPIDDGTLIFSRVSSDISQSYTSTDQASLTAMSNSDILPRTRKYVCTNASCISHTDPTKREACFFRMNNSYKIKYICLACKN